LSNLHQDSIEREKQAQAALDKLKDLGDDDEKKVAAKKKLDDFKKNTTDLLKKKDDAFESFAKMDRDDASGKVLKL
jgi:hypothetical protein